MSYVILLNISAMADQREINFLGFEVVSLLGALNLRKFHEIVVASRETLYYSVPRI